MKLEDQMCSLELAMKLKELGVKQESLFSYHCYKKNREWDDIETTIIYKSDSEEFNDGKWELKIYSAFTVSELGEMLPDSIQINELNYLLCSTKDMLGRWYTSYHFRDDFEILRFSETLVNSMAEVISHLIENKLLKVSV